VQKLVIDNVWEEVTAYEHYILDEREKMRERLGGAKVLSSFHSK